jgi:hypothetical protein
MRNMKKIRDKTAKPARPATRLKSVVRKIERSKADQVKGGRMWTKGGGASVG